MAPAGSDHTVTDSETFLNSGFPRESALPLVPDLLPKERAALVVELKQRAEEKVALQASIRHLELEHAEAEQDYESYRGQLAHRALE